MRTLLLADESITVQRVIALTLAEQPVRVVMASDGRQAIDRMATQKPDIVLAGTSLPNVSGYELARYVKNTPDLKHVPVLLLTGAFEAVDEALLISSGANGVIEKPVEPTTVISRVKELLGLKSEAPTPAPAAGRLVTSSFIPPAPKTPPLAAAPLPTAAPRSPEPKAPPGALGDGYLESLGDALDTLDRQLAGRAPDGGPPRNPSGPLGLTESPADPRSGGQRQRPVAVVPGNPVYEVDDEWFGGAAKTANDAPRKSVAADPSAVTGQPIFEVDDEWFKEDEKARAAREAERRQLAAEMGIHEVELPPSPAVEPPTEIEIDITEADFPARPVPEAPPDQHVQVVQRVQQVQQVQQVQPVRAVRESQPEPSILPTAPLVPVVAAQVASPPPTPLLPAPPPAVPPVAAMPPVPPPVVIAAEPPPAPVVMAVEAPRAPVVAEREIVAPVEEPRGPAAAPEFVTEPVARPLPALFDFAGGWSRTPPKRVEPTPVAVQPVSPIVVPTIVPVTPEFQDHRSVAGRDVADDFAALLAFEQGEQATPPIVEPIIHAVAPEITSEMLEQMAAMVAERLKDSVRVEPLPPQITAAMLEQIGADVSARLSGTVKVEPAMPEITGGMLDQLASTVAERLSGRVHVAPAAPEITGEMLEHVAARVAERLLPNLRVEAPAPVISNEMIDHLAAVVGERLQPTLLGDRLRESITATVHEIVRSVVSETSERLVREEIERIKARHQNS